MSRSADTDHPELPTFPASVSFTGADVPWQGQREEPPWGLTRGSTPHPIELTDLCRLPHALSMASATIAHTNSSIEAPSFSLVAMIKPGRIFRAVLV